MGDSPASKETLLIVDDESSVRGIANWDSCGILEDRYLGALRNDDRNRFTLYADNPIQ